MKVQITQNADQVMATLEGRLDTVTSSEFEKSINPYFQMQLYKDVLFISLEIQLNIFLQKNIKNIHNQLKEYMVHHH